MGKVILDLIKITAADKKGVEVVRTFNDETIKAIEDVEKVLSGEASESILEEKQEDNDWDDDDN